MQVYSNKTLSKLCTVSKKVWLIVWLKQVKKIIYPDKIQGKENNLCNQIEHRAAVGKKQLLEGTSQIFLTFQNFAPSKYLTFFAQCPAQNLK